MRAEHVTDSTRGPALPYPPGMRTSTILIPLLMIFANSSACKDDAPKGGEFGEPCGEIDTPCADGLKCYIGYCEEKCMDDSDCQPVPGLSTRVRDRPVPHLLRRGAWRVPQTPGNPS